MEQKLRQIMANIFEISSDDVTDESSIDTIEKWDSLKHLNLIVAIEEQYNILITEEEMLKMINFIEIKRILGDHNIEL